MTADLNNTRFDVLELLVTENTELENTGKCTENNQIACTGLSCSLCPLYSEEYSIGDVRNEVSIRLQHKPDCLWMLGRTEGITKPCTCGGLNNVEYTDDVKTPSHYMLFEDIESIQVIARTMTQEEFKGFCLGNVLKYRLRAGKKSELATVEKDLAKAEYYKELFNKHKGECRDS